LKKPGDKSITESWGAIEALKHQTIYSNMNWCYNVSLESYSFWRSPLKHLKLYIS